MIKPLPLYILKAAANIESDPGPLTYTKRCAKYI